MDSIIKIENLIFEYKKDDESEANRAIDDVSLEIERGSFTAILGKNAPWQRTSTDCFCRRKASYT